MLRSTYEGQIIGQVEKMNDVVKLFNTKSELPVTNSDAHRLLKYAMKDHDQESDDTFDRMEHEGMLLCYWVSSKTITYANKEPYRLQQEMSRIASCT